MEQNENQIAVIEHQALPPAIIDLKMLDNLESAEASPVDLMTDYWTPELNEKRRVMFDCIDITLVPDQTTGEAIELECAFFFIKENGQAKRIRNGSKRLVGAMRFVQRGTGFDIKYLGKKRNKNNAFNSDNWSISPVIYAANPK